MKWRNSNSRQFGLRSIAVKNLSNLAAGIRNEQVHEYKPKKQNKWTAALYFSSLDQS